MLWHDLNCERVLHMCKSHVSDMKESCPTHEEVMSHTWRSHVPQMIWIAICIYARAMSHAWRSHIFHTWRSHVSHMKESCLTCTTVMSQTWRSHVPHMKESCPTDVLTCNLHMRKSHVSHTKESCLTYEGVMSHTWRSHVPRMKKPCPTYWHQHTLMSIRLAITSCFIAAIACHVSHTKESCLTYEGVMSHIWMSHVSHMNKSRLTYAITSCFIAAIALMSAIASFYMFCNHIHHTHTSSECVCHKSQVLPSCRVRHPLSPKKILVRCWPISLKNYTHR